MQPLATPFAGLLELFAAVPALVLAIIFAAQAAAALRRPQIRGDGTRHHLAPVGSGDATGRAGPT